VRGLGLLLAVTGAVLVPAAPALAHGGDAPAATAYRTTVTAITRPEAGLTVRTVEAGARLELSNRTGHSVEVLGYAGEPYLDVRPDGTYENVHSPAATLNATLTGTTALPADADPTAPPSWRRISTSTTVRWHDQRTHWLSSGTPPQALADPTRAHRLRDWEVPLRVQVRTFAIRGTLDWEPPPRTWMWWLLTAGAGLAATGLALRWSRSVVPVAVIGGLAPLWYAWARTSDGASPSLVLVLSGLFALGAAYRHPPFLLALAGACLVLFGGVTEVGVFSAAVLPAVGPAWLTRLAVALALTAGTALAATGVLRMRAAVPARPAPTPAP
jgi:hypothetical protein